MTRNPTAEATHAASIIVRDGIEQSRSSVEDWLAATYDSTDLLEDVLYLLDADYEQQTAAALDVVGAQDAEHDYSAGLCECEPNQSCLLHP